MLEVLTLGLGMMTAPAAVTTADIALMDDAPPPQNTTDNRLCRSDVNSDGTVDWIDMILVLHCWGATDSLGNVPEDINRNGTVEMGDLLCVFCDWGPCT